MKSSRKQPFRNQRGNSMINALMAITLGFCLIAGVIAFHSYSLQSWTGSGTVVNRHHEEASSGTTIVPVWISQGIYMFSDSSSPESYSLTVKDDNGDEHPFRVTQNQYDEAPIGSKYTKTD